MVGMDQFGQLIQSARTRQALDQAALAKQLGVTQQTISRWETGQVRPRRAALAKLALAIDVPVRELTRAQQDAAAATVASPVTKNAVRPLVETLPLSKLAFGQFEQFITELMQLRFPDAAVNRLGGQGDDQRGYDVLVRHQDGRLVGIQCKQVKQFGKKAIQAVIAAAELKVNESVIALSRPATAAARFEMLEHAGWSLWDQDDLSRQARNQLSREDALRLVDSYFPGMRESFLGVRAPGPWLKPEEFFRVTPTTLLDHRQALVGRQAIVDSIRDWARNGSSPIGLLVGRGGLGKSKLLYEVARDESADAPVQFRFLDVQQQPSQEGFDLLPLEGKLVVVIDDAHDIENVAAIAAQLRAQRPAAKLLLATRPYGETRIDADVWRLNESRLTESRWELGDLNLDEAIELVSELTGLPAINPVTKNLASVSTDLPFIAVVGAGLLKTGDVVARSFSSDATIRRDVLGRFTELTTASGSAVETNERRNILASLAAYQPVQLGDESFQEAMAALTRIPSWDLVSARIRDLEDSGLVLRRGRSVRVVPDMLGDIVLGQAAFDERSNIPTNYLDRAQDAADGFALQHLLINASRMDWQVRDGRPTRSDMLGGLWQTLRDEFVASTPTEQMQLMKLIERMAFYQPDRALALMVEVLELPADVTTDAAAERWSITHRDVVQAVPAVLRNIAYNLDQLDDCLELLWSLAQSDRRPTNQHPDHAMRVLTELASFRAGKPFEYIDRVIEVADTWFHQPYASSVSPFDVLEPILATEGSDETSSGLSITIRSFGIDPKSVHELRQRVIDIAVRQARQPDPASATRAVLALEQAVRYPMGLAGRARSDNEVDAWTDEFIPTIEVLGEIGSEPEHDPAVRIAVRRALGWLADVDAAPAKSKAAAKAALAKLASSVEDELALCLHDGWGRLGMRDGKSYEDAERERVAKFKDVAERLIQGRSDKAVLELVERRLAVERAAFREGGESGRFLWELYEVRPDLAAGLCNQAVAGRLPELSLRVDLALSVLFTIADNRAMALAERLRATSSLEMERSVASALSWRRGRRDHMLPCEFDLLARLGRHEDEVIRAMVGRAIFLIGLSDKVVAFDLLAQLKFGGSGKVASEALSALVPQGTSNPWNETDSALRASVVSQLIECRSIDFYEVMAAIGALSKVDPVRVTDMLIARIDRQETGDDSDYDALPSRLEPGLQIAETSALPKCLTRTRDWLTRVGPRKPYYLGDDGAKLYGLVAGQWDEQAIAVLASFDVRQLEASVTAVARILAHAPRRVIFDNVDLVTKTLRDAKDVGPETVKLVSSLMSSAYNVTFSASWGGQPAPEDVQQRDRAAEIARQLPRGSVEAKFYQALADNADARIRILSDDHDDLPDGRDWR